MHFQQSLMPAQKQGINPTHPDGLGHFLDTATSSRTSNQTHNQWHQLAWNTHMQPDVLQLVYFPIRNKEWTNGLVLLILMFTWYVPIPILIEAWISKCSQHRRSHLIWNWYEIDVTNDSNVMDEFLEIKGSANCLIQLLR